MQWYSYFHVMMTWLVNNPVKFNGLVHIDEMAIGSLQKYNRGREDLPDTRWLFGINDQASHKIALQFIDDKSHESIIPITERHVQVAQQNILMEPKFIDAYQTKGTYITM